MTRDKSQFMLLEQMKISIGLLARGMHRFSLFCFSNLSITPNTNTNLNMLLGLEAGASAERLLSGPVRHYTARLRDGLVEAV